MKIQELRTKFGQVLDQLEEMTKKADAENRDFSTDEAKKFDDLEAEANALKSRIHREERMSVLEREGEKRSQVTYEPAGETRELQKSQQETESRKWESMGEFLQAVVRSGMPGGEVDPRLLDTRKLEGRAASGASSYVNSDGGFLVEKDFAGELLKRTYEKAALASRVRRIPIGANANGLKINAIDETSRVDGSRYGGVQAYWAAEAGTVTAKRPKFRQIELNLHKLMGLCHITEELMSDAPAMGAIINDAFSSEFAFMLDSAILRGSGQGQPLGVINSNALVTVSKESGQAAASLDIDNIFKMRSRLWAASRANSVWFINQDVEPQLHALTLGNIGTYFPAGSFAGQPYDQLYGRPVIPIEQCSTIGTVGDVCLLDLNEYLLIEKGGFKADTSVHVRFLYDEMAFRFTYRVDGQPLWNSTLTPHKGSNTQSPFVTLETRS